MIENSVVGRTKRKRIVTRFIYPRLDNGDWVYDGLAIKYDKISNDGVYATKDLLRGTIIPYGGKFIQSSCEKQNTF